VITRPLDLLSKLRPAPRNYDFLFLVNGGLIALFFSLFGSHFVLSPGLTVNDGFSLRSDPDAVANARITSVRVSIYSSGEIWSDTGLINPAKLQEWMATQVKRAPGSTLLVQMDTRASMEFFTTVAETAKAAGFGSVQIAMQQASASGDGTTTP
jgi:biopolymer transport protein ExbD